MLTSKMGAPCSTCSRASSTTSFMLPALMSCARSLRAVGLMRSPIKFSPWRLSIITTREREASALKGIGLLLAGAIPRRVLAMACICSGVVPQQPPMMLAPAWRRRRAASAISSGESGKTVFPCSNTGSPALGSTERYISLKRPISAITGNSSLAPPEQLAPIASGLKASKTTSTVLASLPIIVRPWLSKLI